MSASVPERGGNIRNPVIRLDLGRAQKKEGAEWKKRADFLVLGGGACESGRLLLLLQGGAPRRGSENGSFFGQKNSKLEQQ